MDIKTLKYADVVANQGRAFSSLDWPIDAQKASVMVQPELYRFRLEAA